MKYFLRAFTPTKNRRLNELIGFLLFVSATLLFLALASYSPLDPSLNTAGSLSSGSAHNWIGLFGAMLSDLLLQSIGIIVFAAPVMIGLLGARWCRKARQGERRGQHPDRTVPCHHQSLHYLTSPRPRSGRL